MVPEVRTVLRLTVRPTELLLAPGCIREPRNKSPVSPSHKFPLSHPSLLLFSPHNDKFARCGCHSLFCLRTLSVALSRLGKTARPVCHVTAVGHVVQVSRGRPCQDIYSPLTRAAAARVALTGITRGEICSLTPPKCVQARTPS
jgi:hypothetical protein